MLKLIELLVAQHKHKKAMNLLAKQEWAVDFLIYLLRKSQIQDIMIKITEPGGRVLEITRAKPEPNRDYFAQERHLTQDEWDQLLGL